MNETLKCRSMKSMRFLVGIPCLAAALAFPRTASAQQAMGSPKAGGAVTVAALPSNVALTRNGAPITGKLGSEGIQVHGHWVIDIKNPDGTLAHHHEFENSLNFLGGAFLVGLLSGQLAPGNVMIVLGPSGNGACVGASFQWCGIAQSLTTLPASSYCATDYTCTAGLTTTTAYGTTAVSGPFTWTLAGSITANQTGQIGSVYTLINTCGAAGYNANTQNPSQPSTYTASTCQPLTGSNALFGPLTNTTVTPISVNNGQLIQVQVTISFS